MRVRPAAHLLARPMGPVALGALCPEDVGKPTAATVFAITEGVMDRWVASAPPVHSSGRLMGGSTGRSALGQENEGRGNPAP
jgi:hypothetical protein